MHCDTDDAGNACFLIEAGRVDDYDVHWHRYVSVPPPPGSLRTGPQRSLCSGKTFSTDELMSIVGFRVSVRIVFMAAGQAFADCHDRFQLAAFLKSGHAAGDVLDFLVTTRLEQTRGNGAPVTAATDDRDLAVVRQVRQLLGKT